MRCVGPVKPKLQICRGLPAAEPALAAGTGWIYQIGRIWGSWCLNSESQDKQKSEVTLSGAQGCGYQWLQEETPELTDTGELALLATSQRTKPVILLFLPSTLPEYWISTNILALPCHRWRSWVIFTVPNAKPPSTCLEPRVRGHHTSPWVMRFISRTLCCRRGCYYLSGRRGGGVSPCTQGHWAEQMSRPCRHQPGVRFFRSPRRAAQNHLCEFAIFPSAGSQPLARGHRDRIAVATGATTSFTQPSTCY